LSLIKNLGEIFQKIKLMFFKTITLPYTFHYTIRLKKPQGIKKICLLLNTPNSVIVEKIERLRLIACYYHQLLRLAYLYYDKIFFKTILSLLRQISISRKGQTDILSI